MALTPSSEGSAGVRLAALVRVRLQSGETRLNPRVEATLSGYPTNLFRSRVPQLDLMIRRCRYEDRVAQIS